MGEEDRFDGRKTDPVLQNNWTNGMDNYDDRRVFSCCCFHKSISIVPSVKPGTVSITIISLNSILVLTRIGVDEYNGNITRGYGNRRERVGIVVSDSGSLSLDSRNWIIEIWIISRAYIY